MKRAGKWSVEAPDGRRLYVTNRGRCVTFTAIAGDDDAIGVNLTPDQARAVIARIADILDELPAGRRLTRGKRLRLNTRTP